jgi:predicted Fe-Mo cluster-binding NifX family protein
MKKVIAIPLENGKLCPHFGHCQSFGIVNVENNNITKVTEVIPPQHEPGLYPKWIAEFGTTDVIAGGMGVKAINLFNQQNINVFVGAPIKTSEELIRDFLDNKLILNANYCDH